MRKLMAAVALAGALAVAGLYLSTPVPAHAAPAATGAIVSGYARVTASSLRMRTGPGTGYTILMNMPRGDVVHVLSGPYNSGWYRVAYRGSVGYSFGGWLANTGLAGAALARGYSKIIVVSLSRQQMEAYQNGQPVLIAAATTGQPALATPTGITHITAKRTGVWFYSPWPKGSPYYYAPEYVHDAMLFRSGGFFLHDASWRPYYGYRTSVWHLDPDGVWRTGSHGCVNLPLWAAAQLYSWVTIGTPVDVVSW